MLQINSYSENYEGVIIIDDADIASVNGTITKDAAYASFNSYKVDTVKEHAEDISIDMAEFMKTLLKSKVPTTI